MNALWAGIEIAVVGLAIVERLVRRAGGRRWPRARRQGVLAGLAALVAVLALAPRLGLRYGEGLVPRTVAGCLFVLLLIYLWQLLPRLRPLLGSTLPRRPSVVFFLLPLVVYLSVMPWATAERPPDGDEPYYLLLTHSLAYDLDAELTNNYAAEDSRAFVATALEPQLHDPRGAGGELYSRHNVLLPALLAPAYRLGGKHGALAVMCLFAAALAWTTLRLARHRFADRPGPALIAYFILAFTSPLLLYAHQVWVEIPAALLLAIALDAVWSMTPAIARRPRSWLPLVLSLALLPFLKIRFVAVALPLLPMLAARLGRKSWRLVLLAVAGGGLIAAAILGFNQLRYGNPLKYHDLSRLSFYWTELGRYPLGLAGLFFDSSFGLFATAPIWALIVAPGRGKLRPLADLGWVMTPYIILLIPRSEWYGAWSPPFRYGCVALPLFALLLIPPLARRHGIGARLTVGGLTTATAILTTLWVARPGWTYNIAHGRSHLIDIFTLSQSIDGARFFPSGVRPNLALWLWPPLTLVVITLLWHWRRHATGAVNWLGATLPLLALGGLITAAHQLPTRKVEVEDPYVRQTGGESWPENWAVGRTRFRGGWQLRPGDTITSPIVPGGEQLTLEFELKRSGPSRPWLLVRGGDAPWQRIEISDDLQWARLETGTIPWPAEASELHITLQAADNASKRTAILLDRVHLSWVAGKAPNLSPEND